MTSGRAARWFVVIGIFGFFSHTDVRSQTVNVGSNTGRERTDASGKEHGGDTCGQTKTLVNAKNDLGPDTVALRVLISERGKILLIEPISGDPGLYKAARKAVRRMTLRPQKVAGHLVETEIVVRLVFSGGPKKPPTTIQRQ